MVLSPETSRLHCEVDNEISRKKVKEERRGIGDRVRTLYTRTHYRNNIAGRLFYVRKEKPMREALYEYVIASQGVTDL
jgi:hypothetical protein